MGWNLETGALAETYRIRLVTVAAPTRSISPWNKSKSRT